MASYAPFNESGSEEADSKEVRKQSKDQLTCKDLSWNWSSILALSLRTSSFKDACSWVAALAWLMLVPNQERRFVSPAPALQYLLTTTG